MARWQHFEDECIHCGDGAEVLTGTGRDNYAYDGDKARCVGCGCPGTVNISGHEGEAATIDWHDEPDCDCDWCRTHPAAEAAEKGETP
jgi:hypothetical protein